MAVIVPISKAALARLGDAKLGARISLIAYPGVTDKAAYLVHRRPDGALWLVATLLGRSGNATPITDVSCILAVFGTLGTKPRTLDAHGIEVMEYVRTRAKGGALELPDRLLEPSAPAPVPKPPKLPKLAGELGPGCLAQIESVLPDLRANPVAFLTKRGSFVEDVQDIEVDPADLAAFGKNAKRAVDELCRGMVAIGLGLEKYVPASCASYRKPLVRYAAYVRTLLTT